MKSIRSILTVFLAFLAIIGIITIDKLWHSGSAPTGFAFLGVVFVIMVAAVYHSRAESIERARKLRQMRKALKGSNVHFYL